MRFYFLSFVLFLTFGCGPAATTSNNTTANGTTNSSPGKAAVIPAAIEIVKSFPHDSEAFTQGLIFHEGALYEGTGGSRKRGDDFYSSLRKVDLESGKVLQKYDLPNEVFGEGIALLNGKIYQLTWKDHIAYVYDLDDFKLLQEFRYSGDGWGLTEDGTNLYMSNGTHVIHVVNPEDFKTIRTIVVNDENGRPLMELNELEWVKGEIWANVWQTGWIVRIDPATGKLLGRIDLNKLAEQQMMADEHADVLNGIAYDEASDRIFVTGKNWKKLFEIKVVPKN